MMKVIFVAATVVTLPIQQDLFYRSIQAGPGDSRQRQMMPWVKHPPALLTVHYNQSHNALSHSLIHSVVIMTKVI
jgi:hypothetical protein